MSFAILLCWAILVGIVAQKLKSRTGALWGLITLVLGGGAWWLAYVSVLSVRPGFFLDPIASPVLAFFAGMASAIVMLLIIATLPKPAASSPSAQPEQAPALPASSPDLPKKEASPSPPRPSRHRAKSDAMFRAFLIVAGLIAVVAWAAYIIQQKAEESPRKPPASAQSQRRAPSTPAVRPFDPVRLSGTGTQTTRKFILEKGLRTIKATFPQESYLIVELWDADSGEMAQSLLNERRGTTSASKAFRIDRAGQYLLNIGNTRGYWSIIIE